MSILTDLTDPRLQIVEGGGSAQILIGAHSLLITTAQEANDLADLLRKAAWYLEQRDMLVRNRRDRDAAVLLNEVNEELHREWPGGTFAPVSQSHIQRIPITACDCSRTTLCAVHGGAA